MTALVYVAAAIAEIGGCYAVWAVMRLGAPVSWLLTGFASLATFAYLLTLADATAAGRAFAAYGGIYIAASLTWLALVEDVRPDRWDLLGSAICLVGAAVIVWGPRP